VLGRGANVLVSDDGFDGVVVRLDHASFRRVERRGSQVEVGAGVDLMPFARACSVRGLSVWSTWPSPRRSAGRFE
jgi:UDP-N-acetylenolpyruvoylglucosamine reductase